MSDVSPMSGIPELSFDSTLLFPLLFLCILPLLFLSCPSPPCVLAHFPGLFSRKFCSVFVKRGFSVWPLLSARRRQLIVGMCSMLPYGTGICHYAFIYIYIYMVFLFVLFCFVLFCFCPFLFYKVFSIWYR